MSIWKINGNVTNESGNIVGIVEYAFELQDREGYSKKQMRDLAKIASIECEKDFNSTYMKKKAKVDLRTLRNAGECTMINYELKSNYSEISVCTK